MNPCNFEWQVIDKLRRISSLMDQQVAPFCSGAGITPLQLNILLTLHFEGPQTVSELARSACMARTNNSSLCKKMEQDGLVERRRAQGDERQVVVSLTPQATQLAVSFVTRYADSEAPFSTALPEAEAQDILRQIERLLTILEETTGDTP